MRAQHVLCYQLIKVQCHQISMTDLINTAKYDSDNIVHRIKIHVMLNHYKALKIILLQKI